MNKANIEIGIKLPQNEEEGFPAQIIRPSRSSPDPDASASGSKIVGNDQVTNHKHLDEFPGDIESSQQSILDSNPPLSFADKIKINADLQVALFTEPLRVFSEIEKLDLADAIANELHKHPNDSELPSFLSTIRRGHYIIVTACNEASRDWLMSIVPSLVVFSDSKLLSIPARDIGKLKKGLLWLPGREKLSNEILLQRIQRQNAGLKTQEWRIYSRHEEPHGTRLLLGIDSESLERIVAQGNCPQWSITRAKFTPIEEVVARKRQKRLEQTVQKPDVDSEKDESRTGKEKEAHAAAAEVCVEDAKGEPVKTVSQDKVTPQKSAKRKPEEDVSPSSTSPRAGGPITGKSGDDNHPSTSSQAKLSAVRPRKAKRMKDNSGKITEFITREKRSSSLPRTFVSPAFANAHLERSSSGLLVPYEVDRTPFRVPRKPVNTPVSVLHAESSMSELAPSEPVAPDEASAAATIGVDELARATSSLAHEELNKTFRSEGDGAGGANPSNDTDSTS